MLMRAGITKENVLANRLTRLRIGARLLISVNMMYLIISDVKSITKFEFRSGMSSLLMELCALRWSISKISLIRLISESWLLILRQLRPL